MSQRFISCMSENIIQSDNLLIAELVLLKQRILDSCGFFLSFFVSVFGPIFLSLSLCLWPVYVTGCMMTLQTWVTRKYTHVCMTVFSVNVRPSVVSRLAMCKFSKEWCFQCYSHTLQLQQQQFMKFFVDISGINYIQIYCQVVICCKEEVCNADIKLITIKINNFPILQFQEKYQVT